MKLEGESEESSMGGFGGEGVRGYFHLTILYACMKFSNKSFTYLKKAGPNIKINNFNRYKHKPNNTSI